MGYTLPIILLLVFVVLLAFSRRSKQKQAMQAAQRAEAMTVGTQVMTTSGLYGTIVVLNDDESVQLSIAPGVEVRWSTAALRDMASLPDQFRKPMEPGTSGAAPVGPYTPAEDTMNQDTMNQRVSFDKSEGDERA